MSSGDLTATEFTVVEGPEAGSRGLVVRRVADADQKAGAFAHKRVDGLLIYVRGGGGVD